MKPIRNILLTTFLIAATISAFIYVACKKDQCKNVICLNLGACNNGVCYCPVGYEGSRCDTLSRNKFIYTFNGYDSCGTGNPGTGSYQIDFTTVAGAPLEMTMMNVLDNWDDSAICTMQSTDSFTFIGSNNSTTFSGIGKLYHDTLKMTYLVQIDTISYSCSFTGGR